MTQRPITVSHGSFWDPSIGDDDELEPKHALQSNSTGRTSNFVAPAPQALTVAPQERHAVKPFDLSMMPSLHTSEAIDHSDELQRSKGFVWRVAPLSLGFGAGVGGVVLLAGGNATGAIVALFLVFAATWGAAFWYHVSRSPSGIAYQQSRDMWSILRTEAEYRRRVDWHERNRTR